MAAIPLFRGMYAQPSPGVSGFSPGMNPEMGGGAMRQLQTAQAAGMARPPMSPTAAMGGLGGMNPEQMAMMLMGAGGAMGQAASPSQYKTGLGTALGAGIGGGLGGMMQHQAMQRDAQRDAMIDKVLQEQMRIAGQQPQIGGGATAANPWLGLAARLMPGQNQMPFTFGQQQQGW